MCLSENIQSFLFKFYFTHVRNWIHHIIFDSLLKIYEHCNLASNIIVCLRLPFKDSPVLSQTSRNAWGRFQSLPFVKAIMSNLKMCVSISNAWLIKYRQIVKLYNVSYVCLINILPTYAMMRSHFNWILWYAIISQTNESVWENINS